LAIDIGNFAQLSAHGNTLYILFDDDLLMLEIAKTTVCFKNRELCHGFRYVIWL